MASIHAEVPRDVDIEASHEIIDRIEREVSKKLGIFLVIHMDPVEVRDERVLAVKDTVQKILYELDPEVTFHDFRMVWGEKRINLIFDVLVPFAYDKEKQKNLEKQICERITERDSRYQCVITVEKSFVS